MQNLQLKPIALAVGLAFALSGCTNLAPDYQQPQVALSEQWVGVALQEQRAGVGKTREVGWRDFFRDARLQTLIETALVNNHDLKTAALNVEIAEQQYGITRAAELPTVAASGSATRSRSSGYVSNAYQAALGVSSFELDFFGRVKNQSENALNAYLQTQEARDSAQLSIINAVAKAYYQWRVADELRQLAAQTLKSREQSYKLVKLRFQEGLASGTDLTTAQSLIASASSAYQQQERNVHQTQNAIATLLGQPLGDVTLPAAAPLSQQFTENALFADVPSEVLFVRPDIRQAEYALKAANANIGVARAAMFPTISLTGSLGHASTELGDLFDASTRTWSFGPSISLPIFDAGQRKANVKVTELQQKVAVEAYQNAVQSAFQDVADALVARETLDKQYQAELDGQRATAETLRMVKLQVQEGLANGLNLLDAERADFSTRQGVLSTELLTLNNRVDLYTALGGGLHENSTATE